MKKIRVSGKVQGVFFRASAKKKADEIGIHGIVKNEQDGSVYIEAEGPQHLLEEFITWCHKGPVAARVSQVEVEETEARSYRSFEIIR